MYENKERRRAGTTPAVFEKLIMHQIWKYALPVKKDFELEIPDPFFPLSVQVQGGLICLWVLINPDAPKIMKKFSCHGTGHNIDVGGKTHIGTVQLEEMVWHYFMNHNH